MVKTGGKRRWEEKAEAARDVQLFIEQPPERGVTLNN
jgi:hypothetical protein